MSAPLGWTLGPGAPGVRQECLATSASGTQLGPRFRAVLAPFWLLHRSPHVMLGSASHISLTPLLLTFLQTLPSSSFQCWGPGVSGHPGRLRGIILYLQSVLI